MIEDIIDLFKDIKQNVPFLLLRVPIYFWLVFLGVAFVCAATILGAFPIILVIVFFVNLIGGHIQ